MPVLSVTVDQPMSKRYEQASVLVHAIYQLIFLNVNILAGLQRSCDMFTLRHNGARGIYVVSGILEPAEKAVAVFKQKQATGYLTPNKIRRWFESWATITFFPEHTFSATSNVVLADEYDGSANIALRVEIAYDVANNYCCSRNTTFSLREQHQTPDETMAYEQRWLDAGIPQALIDHLKSLHTNDRFNPNTPESMEVAENVLARANCAQCHQVTSKKCAACKFTRYCSSTCQRVDWPRHKKNCDFSKIFGEMLERQSCGV